MSTTLTILLGYKNHYVVGNIGDSKTCRINNSVLEQISIDHSYLQEYKTKFPKEPIPLHLKQQLGRVITRSVCARQEEIDIFPMNSEFSILKKGEAFLLCSDGLILDTLLSEPGYLDTLPGESVEEFVNQIINDAFDKGSKDNISVVYGICQDLDR